jgi:hypothetical protein
VVLLSYPPAVALPEEGRTPRKLGVQEEPGISQRGRAVGCNVVK